MYVIELLQDRFIDPSHLLRKKRRDWGHVFIYFWWPLFEDQGHISGQMNKKYILVGVRPEASIIVYLMPDTSLRIVLIYFSWPSFEGQGHSKRQI